MAREEQHREMRDRRPRSAHIDERSDNTSWTGQPPVCEPTKPSGTPPSHGGDKSSGR